MDTPSVNNPMISVDNKCFRLNLFALAKRYRPLYEGKTTAVAVGVYAEDGRQLVYQNFANEDEQQQWLDRLNAAISEFGVPEGLVMLPDGAFVLEKLIKSGRRRPVGRGCAVELYGYKPSKYDHGMQDKPLVTVLVESTKVADNYLTDLTKRLNRVK